MIIGLPNATVYGGSQPGPVRPVFALGTDGPSLTERATGRHVRVESFSNFMLYKLFLEGKDITPLLRWCRDVMGDVPDFVCPAQRIFGMAKDLDGGVSQGGVEFIPQHYGERFYTGLPDFGRLLADWGFWFSFVVFVNAVKAESGPPVMPSRSDQQRHLDRLFEIAKGIPNMVIEEANEPEIDTFDLRAVKPSNPGDVLWATGAGDFVRDDHMPTGRLIFYHGDRGRIDEGPRRGEFSHPLEAGKEPHFYRDGSSDAHHTWPGFSGPVGDDEPQCFSDAPTNRWGDERDTNPDNAEDHAAAAATGAAWLTFHFELGTTSGIPGPITTACARRWFAGAHLIPVDAVRGSYSHDSDDASFPLEAIGHGHSGYATEVVARRLSDGRYIVVATQPLHYTPVPKSGHRVTQVLNARGNAFFME